MDNGLWQLHFIYLFTDTGQKVKRQIARVTYTINKTQANGKQKSQDKLS